MEAKSLITPKNDHEVDIIHVQRPTLSVSELFYDTIQGEGIYTGCPSVFLRLKGCTLNCSYCDTRSAWRYGSDYTFGELLSMIEDNGLITRFHSGHHLVITGGSPLDQQAMLILFLEAFEERFKFTPFIEIENECVIIPKEALAKYVNCWNNSPKLSNSGMTIERRYKPTAIYKVAKYENSWFKFVIKEPTDWNEIYSGYISKGLVDFDQIILMAEGETRDELLRRQENVVNMAVTHGVRYSAREHIIIWDNKAGV